MKGGEGSYPFPKCPLPGSHSAMARGSGSSCTIPKTRCRSSRLQLSLLLGCENLLARKLMLRHFLSELILQLGDLMLLSLYFGLIGIGLQPEAPQLHSLADELISEWEQLFLMLLSQLFKLR